MYRVVGPAHNYLISERANSKQIIWGKIHNNPNIKQNLETSLMKYLKLMTFSFTDRPKGGFSQACSSKGIISLSLSTRLTFQKVK